MRFHQIIVALTVLLLISPFTVGQTANLSSPTYDAVRDFSIQSNPNGVWSYGYLTSWKSPLILYPWGGSCAGYDGISYWLPSPCSEPPFVAQNNTDQTVCYETWCVPPTLLYQSPGPTGMSDLRWTAPSAGRFLIKVTFVGLDYFAPTSNGVHVVLNSKTSLLSGPINSYELPLSFVETGALAVGDTLDFIVDPGADGVWNFGSNGVAVQIWSLAAN